MTRWKAGGCPERDFSDGGCSCPAWRLSGWGFVRVFLSDYSCPRLAPPCPPCPQCPPSPPGEPPQCHSRTCNYFPVSDAQRAVVSVGGGPSRPGPRVPGRCRRRPSSPRVQRPWRRGSALLDVYDQLWFVVTGRHKWSNNRCGCREERRSVRIGVKT